MKIILILLFLSLNFIYISVAEVDSVFIKENQMQYNLKLNERKIDSLSTEIALLKRQNENQNELFSQTISNISTMFDSSTYNLAIFGFLFALIILALGVYVTYIEGKVVKLRDENKSLLSETEKNKDIVVTTNELIQKDIKGLYDKIKREETLYLLKRLVKIPDDILNLTNSLLSRDLENVDFILLKEAFINFLNSSNKEEIKKIKISAYLNLFFQHFCELSIKDDIIRNHIVNFFPEGIDNAFENDIKKSTNDFIQAIIDLGIINMKHEINVYIKEISKSRFSNYKELYKIILKKLKNKDNQFDFFDILAEEDEIKLGKTIYGILLKDAYLFSELNQKEITIIEKIDFLIAEIEIEEYIEKINE